MKIFKKIGIGCLALVICFCSCFKFVNAEIIKVSEPFQMINGNYELYIDVDFAEDNFVLATASINDNEDHSITYYADQGFLQFEGNDIPIDLSFEVEFTYLKDYYDTSNDINYKVYSFVFNEENLISKYSFIYDDIETCFFVYVDNEETSFSVYDTIYNLVDTFIFGGSIETGSHQDLTATILSSIICVLVFALPFLIIWKVIKVIMG